MANDDIIDQLNKLIETCKDGEYGFRTSADHVKSPDLREVFLNRAADCQGAAGELQGVVARLGGAPDSRSSASGALHRGWVAVIGKLSGYSDEKILNECERGEDAALKRYRAALKQPLPTDIMDIVQKQYEGAERNHDQIRTLRDQVHAAS